MQKNAKYVIHKLNENLNASREVITNITVYKKMVYF